MTLSLLVAAGGFPAKLAACVVSFHFSVWRRFAPPWRLAGRRWRRPLPFWPWVTNFSVKLQQLIGDQGVTNGTVTYPADTDRQTGSNLLNWTYGLYQVGGLDLGNSFEYGGKVNFLLGDTLYLNTGDTMAWSTSTDPLTGLLLNFFTNSSGPNIALTVQPTNVDMSADNVPAAGVSKNGNFYIVCKTGHTTNTLNTNDYSVLVRFNERTTRSPPAAPFRR